MEGGIENEAIIMTSNNNSSISFLWGIVYRCVIYSVVFYSILHMAISRTCRSVAGAIGHKYKHKAKAYDEWKGARAHTKLRVASCFAGANGQVSARTMQALSNRG